MVTPSTGAATRHVELDTSNSSMARVPLHPRLTQSQKRSRPTPNGDTTPIPLMTTRAADDSGTGPIVVDGMHRSERLFVWLGGGVFVLSLAACAARYLLTWSTPAPQSRAGAALAVDLVLFTLFAAHHSVFARADVKQRLAALVPDRLLRSVYVWTASVLLLLTMGLWVRVGGEIYHAFGWARGVLALAQLAGVWLIARSVRAIDPLELAGIHPGRTQESLQIAGPYKLVRHPLYLGWMLAVFGAAHMTGDRLAFAAMTSLYLVVAIPWEERSLVRAFGDSYERYQQQVRWRVVPYVY